MPRGKFRLKNVVDYILKNRWQAQEGKTNIDGDVDIDVSSIPPIIVTSDVLSNDDTPSDSLFPARTYIDILLDVRLENTTPNKGDVPNEGKVSDINIDVSSIPLIFVTNDNLCNDDTPSNLLLPSGTYIDVLLDIRVENTTPNKGDVPNEGKVSDVTLSKLKIQRKITHMHQVNLDREKWLPENWRFGIKVRTTRATT
ncbi:hypothetical protein H5410_052126 [Solanum commersonii]|uniref:Uncharacterized protein n=1 Tax=Solanum commersonii TaxID=4109 RepID=A0A9J5X0A8_SOLCO|nr:hypothetical protein H5410_052126 [Solanum commersonii]